MTRKFSAAHAGNALAASASGAPAINVLRDNRFIVSSRDYETSYLAEIIAEIAYFGHAS
jgi:hypothetical protein